jgi:hypothetical protein
VPKAASSGDTGDSWQEQQGTPAATAQLSAAQRLAGSGGSGSAASQLARQGSGPAPASKAAGKKASPPLPRRQAGESRRRGSLDRPQDGERGRSATAGAPAGASRRSLDLGMLARGAGRTLSPSPESSSGNVSGGGASGLQRAPSGGLKRVREGDVLLAALGEAAQAADTPPNPFSLASAGTDDDWQPAGIAGGVEDAATDQLAAGLSRLEMRTLSLKRQCSRDDTALDALDQALLMEKLAAHDPSRPPPLHGLARALSMPNAASQRRSPPIPHFGAQHASPNAAPQGGWLAQEQMRLLPRATQAHGPLPQARPQTRAEVAPFAANQLDVLAGPFDSDPPLLSDPSLAAMLFGMPLPSPKALPVDIASDSCLLPDLSPPGDPLRRNNSSGLLLECGEQGGSLHHASSSGSARLLRGSSNMDVLEQAAAAAVGAQQRQPVGPPAKDDPAVTAVGPAGAEDAQAGPLARPLGSSGDLLSPFGSVNDHEVEDLLAEFLSPGHTGQADQLLGELLLPLTPTGLRTGSGDDALAGLAVPGLQSSADPAAVGQQPGAAAAAAGLPQSTAFAAAAHAELPLLSDFQYSAGSPLSGGGMGSGSIQSYDTPTSTGAMALPGAVELSLSASTGTLQLAAKLLADPDPVKHALAAELLQRAQAKQAAAQAAAPQLPPAAPQLQQQQAQQPLAANWPQLEQQLAAQLAPAAAPAPAPASQGKLSLAELAQELQQAVKAHREAQQRYLMHREQVHTMLLQRQLGPSGSAERAAQLARLKSLKLQLATAQQRQNELRVAYEVQSQLAQHHQQQAQQQPAQFAAQGQQPLMRSAAALPAVPQGLGDGGSGGLMAFDASAVRLGPPPPLPSSAGLAGFAAAGAMPDLGQLGAAAQPAGFGATSALPTQLQQAAYGNQPLLQELLGQQELAPSSNMTALLQQWTTGPEAAALPSVQPGIQLPSAWPVPSAATGWGGLPPQPLQSRLAMQQVQQMQPSRLHMARASSAPAPLPFDLDWSSMLR